MSITEFQGRTFDLLAYQGAVAGGEVLTSQQLLGGTNFGQITTGIQKLAQKVLLILLTQKGSKPHDLTFGTDFMTDARRGYFQTPLDVFSAFSAALVDIKQRLQSEELSSDLDDETFAGAEIVSVSLGAGTASVLFELTSVAGTTARFIAPLSFVV
jgi:hypothetical protein